ncbi:Flp family type IVb pilin [Azospirillum soli]|uniref:Flp family type IVb pilin n=1 Tax=Azospirillum soli TaxID=1304799 RepID=UPI001AE3C50C|nr:hypothetical protein [Azospirillum soli]MBP2316721.1 Flp pilus assembly pilin Flp [Azospirillum soli]
MNNVFIKAYNAFVRFSHDERGTQLVETAVWIGLITALVVATVDLIGGDVSTSLTNVHTAFTTARTN